MSPNRCLFQLIVFSGSVCDHLVLGCTAEEAEGVHGTGLSPIISIEYTPQ